MHWYVLGTDGLESKLAEKVLVCNKVTLKITLSQQCALVPRRPPPSWATLKVEFSTG